MRNWRTSSIRSSNWAGAMAILTVMMLLLALLSLCLGAEMVNPGKILAELLEGGRDSAAVRIFLYVRLPRTCACLLAGASLAVAGTIIQGVLANSLAAPVL